MDSRFLEGLRLFNEKDYFDCHEVIEALWLQTPPTDPFRDLYKGVIQAAAAIYQWDRGILSGASGLYRSSIGYLEKYLPEAMGLKVDKMVLDMRKCFAPFEKWDGQSTLKREPFLTPHLNYRVSDQ